MEEECFACNNPVSRHSSNCPVGMFLNLREREMRGEISEDQRQASLHLVAYVVNNRLAYSLRRIRSEFTKHPLMIKDKKLLENLYRHCGKEAVEGAVAPIRRSMRYQVHDECVIGDIEQVQQAQKAEKRRQARIKRERKKVYEFWKEKEGQFVIAEFVGTSPNENVNKLKGKHFLYQVKTLSDKELYTYVSKVDPVKQRPEFIDARGLVLVPVHDDVRKLTKFVSFLFIYHAKCIKVVTEQDIKNELIIKRAKRKLDLDD